MSERNPSFTIEPSKSGPPTLAVLAEGKKVYLHSRVDPLKEGESLRGRFDPGKYDLLVVLGVGLGYHLAPLAELSDRYRLIVLIDALPGMERTLAPSAAALADDTERVRFLCGLSPDAAERELEHLIDLESAGGIQVVEHPASLRACTVYYEDVKALLERIINRKAGEKATVGAFGFRYLMNIVRNLAQIGSFRPAAPLFGAFEGYPALVLTPGPSLEELLPLVRERQGKVYIVAADSALPVLSRSGITADFTVSIDPQVYVHEHFAHGLPGRTVPVYALPVHPLPFRRFPGLVYLNSHPLCQLIEERRPGLFGSANSATGNVAGDAVMLARRLGFAPLGLAGFDFSFPRYCIYCRGSAYQERFACYFQERFAPVESRNFLYVLRSSRGLRQGGLHTRHSFLRYRDGIGRLIADTGLHVRSLTSRGVPMEGVPIEDAADFLGGLKDMVPSKEEVIGQRMAEVPLLDRGGITKPVLSLLNDEEILGRVLAASLMAAPDSPRFVRSAQRLRRLIEHFL